MHSAIRIFSLLSIVCLTLGSLTGCGEKRIHVATVSGAPGEEAAALSPRDESAITAISGLSEASIDESLLAGKDSATDELSEESALSAKDSAADELFNESALSGQDSVIDELPMEVETSAMINEPVNMAHAPSTRSSQDGYSDSFMADSRISPQESGASLADSMMSAQASGVPGSDGSFAPFGEGRDFAAQSSSSPEEHGNHSLANIENFQEAPRIQYSDPTPSPLSQNSSAGLGNAFSGEDGEEVEPVQEVFQIAKVEPSDGRQDQLNRIKSQGLAASAKDLEDVFFQFDSWTLTQEGQRALERTLGWFNQDPSSNLIIEGHADQRGTEAYNMILAKKRAVAVQDYLSQLGIDPSRIAVISYGKDKPFCQDTTEVCYQLNRRGHLLISNR